MYVVFCNRLNLKFGIFDGMVDSLGKVYFIGGGPGDPDLLTLRAVKCLEAAEVVFYDDFVDQRTLEFTQTETKLVPVGQDYKQQAEINRIMINEALAGKVVVRLKGGDPHIFGKLCEEMLALYEKGIPFEVVPGVTAASAAAQVAGISLTDRHNMNAVAFVTGLLEHDSALVGFNFECLASFPGSLIFYMGIATADVWRNALLKGGKSRNTPVLIIYKATFADQRLIRTTLSKVVHTIEQEKLDDSCIVIVGKVTDYNAEEPVIEEGEETEWLNRR